MKSSRSSTVTPTAASSSSALTPPDSQLVKETLAFIRQGDTLIASKQIKENIVIVLGPTGAGKGTLINYLSGTVLKPTYQGGTWKLSAETTLPDISISHSRQSDTFYPAIYSPEGKNFSYIDSPGFGDSRGVAHDIATAYFRQKIMEIKEIKSIKMLLTLPYKDFSGGRGDIVKGYINALDQFLQLNKNAENIDELKQAIALVITQADAPRFSMEELRDELNARRANANEVLSGVPEGTRVGIIDQLLASDIQKFNESLQEVSNTSAERKGTIAKAFKEQGGIQPEAKKVFDHLAESSNFEIFSKPIIVSQDKAAMVAGEKDQILRLIDKSRYIDKSKIEIGLTVSPDSKLVVIHLAKNINGTIGGKVKESVSLITKVLSNMIDSSSSFSEFKGQLHSKAQELDLITQSKTSDDFSQKIAGKLDNSIEQEIKKYIEYLKFLKKLNDEVEYEVDRWHSSLPPFIEQVKALTEHKYETGSIITKGQVVSLRSVYNYIEKHDPVEAIKIYALRKIFLDHDFQHEKLKGVNLAIISPSWQIVGDSVTIDLSGKDGANYASKAEQGKDGKPGHPGKSGGDFLGIGRNYDNLDKLTINANGGKGGRGQDGGDGENGKDGGGGNYQLVHARDPSVMISRKKVSMDDETDTLNKAGYVAKKLVTPLNSTFVEEYESKGVSGEDGQDSGRGGEGGKGGYYGDIQFANEPLDSSIKLMNNGIKGQAGKAGIHGKGGEGGITWYGKFQDEVVLPGLRAEYKNKDITEQEAREDTSRAAAIAVAETTVAVAGAAKVATSVAEVAVLAAAGTVATVSSGGIAALVIGSVSLLGSVIGTPVSAAVNTKWLEEPIQRRESGGKDGVKPTEKNAQNIKSPQPSQKFTTQIIGGFQEYYNAEVGNPFVDQGVLGELASVGMELLGDNS